jgi:hypothetical protein
MMHRKRPYLVAVVAATALAASAATALIVGRQHNDARATTSPPPGTLAILSRAPIAADHVPPELLKLPVAEQFASPSAAGARFALSDDGRDYFVIPGKSGTTCLVYTRGAGADFDSGGTCAANALLRTGAIYITEPEADGTLLASMLVSDGYARATSNGVDVPVRSNVVILHGASQVVSLSGSVTGQVDFGPQTPSGSISTQTSTTATPTATVGP